MVIRPSTLADGVAAVTLGFGTALTAAPERTAGVLGLGPDRRIARGLGLADLVLGSLLLLRRRRRAPLMAARAALNVVIVGCYLSELRRTGAPRAKVGATAMVALTVHDGALALSLRDT